MNSKQILKRSNLKVSTQEFIPAQQNSILLDRSFYQHFVWKFHPFRARKTRSQYRIIKQNVEIPRHHLSNQLGSYAFI